MPTTLIVYVHGALSTKNSWNYIRQKLVEKLQRDKISEEFIKYDLNVEASEDIVLKMAKKVKVWIKEQDTSDLKLVMIGHSFGGVLAVATVRVLQEFLEEANVEAKVITMSSPFAGSEVATFLRILRPRSQFFKNVGSSDPFIKSFKSQPLPCSTHVFVTSEGGADWMPQANDGVVTVESQMQYLDDPNATHQQMKVNHFEILLSDEVVNRLYKELA